MLCLLSLILVITAFPVTASAYDMKSDTWYSEEGEFINSVNLKNAKQKAVFEYIYADYLSGNDRYKGKGQCYGYAEMIRKMFGKKYKQRKYGVKATYGNVYKRLKKLKPGSHIRFSAKKGGGGMAHSIVLLKVTKDEIWYTDGNVGGYNEIRYARESLSYFCQRRVNYGHKYLAWAREPKGGVSTVKSASVKTSVPFDVPETHVAWRLVKGAKKYEVYRSAFKDSGYAKIGESKSGLFIDRSNNLYGKVFYKVVAVKSGKKRSASKPAEAHRRLTAPVVYLTGDDSSGSIQYDLSWSAVPGAAKYNIYIWDYDKDRPILMQTVSGTSCRYTGPVTGYAELYITAEASRAGSESLPAMLYL